MANNSSEKCGQEYSKRIMDDSTYQDELSVAITELERENLTFYCQDSIRRCTAIQEKLTVFCDWVGRCLLQPSQHLH